MDAALDHYVKRLSQRALQVSLKALYDARPKGSIKSDVPFVCITLSYLGERCKLWKDDMLLKKARVDTIDALKKSDLADLAKDLEEMHAHVAATASGSFLVLVVLQKPGCSPESQVLLLTPPVETSDVGSK
jgi:hypothetical protein